MQDIQLFLRRAADKGSIKRMMHNIEMVHNEFGQSRILTLADMLLCMTQGFGHLDYLTFGFACTRGQNRKTFMTMQDNISFAKQMNDREYLHVLRNKLCFCKTYKPFLGRETIDLADGSETFSAFVQKHPEFFAKAPVSFGGQSVQRVDTRQYADLKALYSALVSEGLYLLEECIVQHPLMNELCAACVNTLRVVTVVQTDGTVQTLYTLLRVGNGNSEVDNISSGGMYTVPSESGEIIYPFFCDKTALYYENHPQTGFSFRGFRIPYYEDCIALCRQAALVEPHIRYVGWDVAVTPTGPVLVEGNNLPGYDMCQNYRFRKDGRGMKAAFQAVAEK